MADTLKEQSSFLERGDSCLSLVDIESSDAQSELSELDDSMAESMAEFDLDQDSEVSSVNGGETEATKEIPAAEVNESSSKGPVSTVEGTNRQGKGIPVFRMSSSDSLFGQLFGSRRNENAAPLQPPKTRRGGRRSNATTPAEGPSEPQRGVARLNTSDSLQRGGVRAPPEPQRGVVRTTTSDSLHGVEAPSRAQAEKAPPPSSRTRRGGRRNQAETVKTVEAPSRGVFRTNTGDSLVRAIRDKMSGQKAKPGDSLLGQESSENSDCIDEKIRPIPSSPPPRRGGRRNVVHSAEGEAPQRGVVRTNTGDSLVRSMLGRRVERNVPRTSTGDSLMAAQAATAGPDEHAACPQTKTRRGGRRKRLPLESKEIYTISDSPTSSASDEESIENRK